MATRQRNKSSNFGITIPFHHVRKTVTCLCFMLVMMSGSDHPCLCAGFQMSSRNIHMNSVGSSNGGAVLPNMIPHLNGWTRTRGRRSISPLVSFMGRAITETEEDDDGEDKSTTRNEDDVFYGNYRNNNDLDEDEEYNDAEDEELSPPIPPSLLDDEYDQDETLSQIQEIESMTVSQLKQQLRLRGLKVSGLKNDLISRLVDSVSPTLPQENEEEDAPFRDVEVISDEKKQQLTAAQKFAKENNKNFVDVSAYVEDDEESKDTSTKPADSNEEEEGAEIWGADAKITSELAGNPVVDNISRTYIEYKGYNHDKTTAYVSASREALQSFLRGGNSPSDSSNSKSPARKVGEVQRKREVESRKSSTNNQAFEGADDLDYDYNKRKSYGIEDYSDVGLYTATGASVSAKQFVQGILFLSDVRGCQEDINNLSLCDKIAFECQPCVVMAPDLFRGHPWVEVNGSGMNEEGEDYEKWRMNHPEDRVHGDIRAAAAVLRERYGVTSVAVFGTCFGGGRALEAVAGYFPDEVGEGSMTPPPPVNPSACIAWYPTRYDAKALFGKDRHSYEYQSSSPSKQQQKQQAAIMAIFAGEDIIPGALPSDAANLQTLLGNDDSVKDFMVKVFSNQPHGFAHVEQPPTPQTSSSSNNDDDDEINYYSDYDDENQSTLSADGEVAFLLSTAWMETYTRDFLPTVGKPIKDDENAKEWNTQLEMKDLTNLPQYQDENEYWENYDYTPQVMEWMYNNGVGKPDGGGMGDDVMEDERFLKEEISRQQQKETESSSSSSARKPKV